MRSVNLFAIFCALFLINELFPQPGDTSTIVYAPPRDSRPDSVKPNLPPDMSPVTTPVVAKNLFTVVLWSGIGEAEARKVAKYYDKKGFDLKIFQGSGFKKSDFMVTTGFFKTRLDAEFFKRGLITNLKNRKLWVKQIDSRMTELLFVPSGKKPAAPKGSGKNRTAPSGLDNTSLTSLLNTGRLVLLYGTADDLAGLQGMTDPATPFLQVVFNGGSVASISGERSFPKSLNLYKRFFLTFMSPHRFNQYSPPVLITMPDRSRLMAVKNFIDSDASMDQPAKKEAVAALNKVTRQLVLKDSRIWLAKKGDSWYIAGVEEIK